MNLSEICKLLSDQKSYVEIDLELAFFSEYGKQMIGLIELLEVKRKPTAHQIYNAIQEFQNSLECGKSSVSYSARLESIIDNKTRTSKVGAISKAQKAQKTFFEKNKIFFSKFYRIFFFEKPRKWTEWRAGAR